MSRQGNLSGLLYGENMYTNKYAKTVKTIGIILFITLVFSAVYSFTRLIFAPTELTVGAPYQKIKSDYLLMLSQCLLGLFVMALPSAFSRKFKIVVPNTIVILYYVFLYCAIYLGEVRGFYAALPFWDDVLHAFSGAMLGALGIILVDLLNKNKNVSVCLSPFFISLFAFCFALSLGAIWEIYEFSLDMILGLNMQKHTVASMQLLGRAALVDTMKDIIIDAVSALIVAGIGYFLNRKYNKEEKNQTA